MHQNATLAGLLAIAISTPTAPFCHHAMFLLNVMIRHSRYSCVTHA
jgi:hypothetical protein